MDGTDREHFHNHRKSYWMSATLRMYVCACVLVCADEGVHVHWCMCGKKSRKSVNKLISDLS